MTPIGIELSAIYPVAYGEYHSSVLPTDIGSLTLYHVAPGLAVV